MANEALLRITLEAAVPLWIEQVRQWPEEHRAERRKACSEFVAAHGDDIQYRGKHSAEGFNRLAEGLALMAFAPGGVAFLGVRWEAKEEGLCTGQAQPLSAVKE